MQRPERPVPEDQRLATPDVRRFDLTDEDVVVARAMALRQPALEPGAAAIDERDPVEAQPVRDVRPARIDGRRPARKAIRQKLLRAR